MRHRRAPTSAQRGAGGKLTKFRLLVPARYNTSLSPRGVDRVPARGCERRVNFRLSLSLALTSSLFAAEGSYYGVISAPPATFPRHIAVLNSHIVTPCDPGEVQSRTHSGGGYCNFYRWTGMCALTRRKKNQLYEMTRPIAQGTPEPRGYIYIHADIDIHIYFTYIHMRARVCVFVCVHIYIYSYMYVRYMGCMAVAPRAVGPRPLFARLSFALAANTRHAE